jgi:hypothetical protein
MPSRVASHPGLRKDIAEGASYDASVLRWDSRGTPKPSNLLVTAPVHLRSYGIHMVLKGQPNARRSTGAAFPGYATHCIWRCRTDWIVDQVFVGTDGKQYAQVYLANDPRERKTLSTVVLLDRRRFVEVR